MSSSSSNDQVSSTRESTTTRTTRSSTSSSRSTTTSSSSTSSSTPTRTTVVTTTTTTQVIVTPTIIVITPSFASPSTTTFITTLTTIISTGTASITSTGIADSNSGDGFFDNKGAVGGVFAVVGIVALLILAGLVWLIFRRRRQKRMDADVMAAASAAAAHNRTPFDYDDEDPEMIEGPNSYPPRAPTPGAGTAYGTVNSYNNYGGGHEGYEPSHFSAGTGPGYAGMGTGYVGAGAAAGAAAGAYGAYYAGQTHDGSGHDPYAQFSQQTHSDHQHARQPSFGGVGAAAQPWGAAVAGPGSQAVPGSPPMDASAMPNPYSTLSPAAAAAGAYGAAGPSPPLGGAAYGDNGRPLSSGGVDASHQYLAAAIGTGTGGGGASSSIETGPTAVSNTVDGAPKPAGAHADDGVLDDDEAAHLASGRPDPRFMMNQEHAGSSASLRDDQDYSRRLGL